MKKSKIKKTTLKNNFAKYCRATILSLFVILTLPSISSGIFGNGDAEAGCVGGAGNKAVTDSFCLRTWSPGGTATDCTNQKFPIAGAGTALGVVCTHNSNSCTPTANTISVDCNKFSDSQCNDIAGCTLSFSTNENALTRAVCMAYRIATGSAGKAFAAIGVISCGIGFFTGKVSWGLMISVAAGIAVFFGAPAIIAVISGDQTAGDLCDNY